MMNDKDEKINSCKFLIIIFVILILSTIASPLCKKIKFESLSKKIMDYCDIKLDYYEDYYMYYDYIDLNSRDNFF